MRDPKFRFAEIINRYAPELWENLPPRGGLVLYMFPRTAEYRNFNLVSLRDLKHADTAMDCTVLFRSHYPFTFKPELQEEMLNELAELVDEIRRDCPLTRYTTSTYLCTGILSNHELAELIDTGV